jgi:hypothetical protein
MAARQVSPRLIVSGAGSRSSIRPEQSNTEGCAMLKYVALITGILIPLSTTSAADIPAAELKKFAEKLAALRMQAPGSEGAATWWNPKDPSAWDSAFASATPKMAGVKAYSSPDEHTTPIANLNLQEQYTIVGKSGDWLAVQFEKSGTSSKVGWVQQAAVATGATEEAGWWDRQILSLLEEAAALKQEYDTNPYVTVTGFSMSLSFPPSLDVQFEFK